MKAIGINVLGDAQPDRQEKARPYSSHRIVIQRVRRSGCTAGQRSGNSELDPLDFASLNNVTHAAFAAGQARASRLDLQEHDTPQLAFGKTIKDHEIDWAAQKANILWIVGECRKIRNQLLVDLAGDDSLTSLHRILANGCSVAHSPNHEVHPGHQKTDRDSEDKLVGVRWQGGLVERACPR